MLCNLERVPRRQNNAHLGNSIQVIPQKYRGISLSLGEKKTCNLALPLQIDSKLNSPQWKLTIDIRHCASPHGWILTNQRYLKLLQILELLKYFLRHAIEMFVI